MYFTDLQKWKMHTHARAHCMPCRRFAKRQRVIMNSKWMHSNRARKRKAHKCKGGTCNSAQLISRRHVLCSASSALLPTMDDDEVKALLFWRYLKVTPADYFIIIHAILPPPVPTLPTPQPSRWMSDRSGVSNTRRVFVTAGEDLSPG